jgi:ABC-2 type transport system permease protein
MRDQFVYQLRLYIRSPRAVIAALAMPLILLVLLAAITEHGAEPGYHETLAGSMATLGLSSMCFTTLAASLVASRDAGVLKRLRATPLPIWHHLAGRVLATVVLAVGQALVLFVIASLAYGAAFPVRWTVWAGLLLGSVAICAVGLAVAQIVPRGDAAATVLTTISLPIVLISGLFFRVDELPGWIDPVADASPLTHVVALLTGSSHWHHAAWLVGWAAAGLAYARWRFRFEPPPPLLRRSEA